MFNQSRFRSPPLPRTVVTCFSFRPQLCFEFTLSKTESWHRSRALTHTHKLSVCLCLFAHFVLLCTLSLSPSFPLSFSCEENIKGSESVGFTPHQSRTYTNITGYRRKCVLELWSSVDAKTTNYKTQLMLKPDRESERKKEWAIQTKESCKG